MTEEGAWAYGDYESPGSQWGWSFDYTRCCSCGTGCTLTQGYWKTHSINGPAPYDEAWAGMEDMPFFTSTYYWNEILWVPPEGDAYIILAHQYIAAYLNVLNGASTTEEVDAALLAALGWFTAYDPGVSPSSDAGQIAVSLSQTLAYYNEGIIGPGHCEE